jgi:CRP/FNR family transcriptional regulator, cyclic AMP receptor protein
MSEPEAIGLETMALLEVEPELRAYLTPDERRLVARVAIPVGRFAAGTLDLDAILGEAGAFGAVILEGVLLHRMAIGDQPALRLLGPGDMLSRSGGARTALLGESSHRVSGQLRLAMLDDRVLLTARRFPRLFAGLQIRLAEQHQRLAAQLVICQLPRVEDRLLALMWLLAETWGRVTASGTVLPIALTHDALGELIGARRPTVTLALKELADRGSLFRQDGEWVLLEPPPQGAAPGPVGAEPRIASAAPTRWAAVADELETGLLPVNHEVTVQELTSMLSALRESHRRARRDVRARLEDARVTRERTQSLREQVEQQRQRISRGRPAPPRRPAP